MSELARAVRKKDTKRTWKFRRPIKSARIFFNAWMMLCKRLGCVSKALEKRLGLPSCSSSKGPASSATLSADSTVARVLTCESVGSGSILITGNAHASSAILIQKGSHRFLLIVKEAMLGPKKDTT